MRVCWRWKSLQLNRSLWTPWASFRDSGSIPTCKKGGFLRWEILTLLLMLQPESQSAGWPQSFPSREVRYRKEGSPHLQAFSWYPPKSTVSGWKYWNTSTHQPGFSSKRTFLKIPPFSKATLNHGKSHSFSSSIIFCHLASIYFRVHNSLQINSVHICIWEHYTYILLLLLLSRFSRVRLCMTP